MERVLKLNLGCRDDIVGGYDNIDLYHVAPGVITTDAITLSQYQRGSITEIYAKDFIEHVSFDQCAIAFTRWYELLKPTGKLIIETPDMDWLLGEYYGQHPHSVLRRLFGPQDDEGQYHRSGWNYSLLREWLTNHSFTNIIREKSYEGNLHIICTS